MKKLTSILITLLFAFNVEGQESKIDSLLKRLKDSGTVSGNTGLPLTFGGGSITLSENGFGHDEKLGKDTIVVSLLVTDTSGIVKSITGYDVRQEYCCINGNMSTYAVYQPVPYYEHLEYLDDKKQPLSKNIIVWQSINQK